MTVSPVFERIYVASQLEQAAIDVLVTWYPTYLREIERQLNITVGETVPPVNYSNRNGFDSQAGEAMPKVVVISPGTVGDPYLSGRTYSVQWALGVGVAMSAQTEGLANMLAKVYGAAARGIIEQKLGGRAQATAVRFLGEQYEDLPIENQFQHYRSASVYFAVDIENIVTRRPGPDMPDDDPYVYGTVEEVIIDLRRMEDLNI